VKNLPKHVAEDGLREFFSEKGIITDVRLMRTKYYSTLLFFSMYGTKQNCSFGETHIHQVEFYRGRNSESVPTYGPTMLYVYFNL